jgi:hypothetical protein
LTNDAAIPVGASKLGGDPDLPADFQWPHYNDKPLTFIGQFKLSEFTQYDTEAILPSWGTLYYFYEAEEQPYGAYDKRDGWQVAYVEDENTPLVRKPHPICRGEYARIAALPAHPIDFVAGLTLPTIFYEDGELNVIRFEGEKNQYGFPAELTAYWSMTQNAYPEPSHFLLGYPRPIQYRVEWECVQNAQQIPFRGDMEPGEYEARHDSIWAEMPKWQFLFQIDTDDSLNVMWGDVGTLYVCIPKASLAARRFEDCWTIMQCY